MDNKEKVIKACKIHRILQPENSTNFRRLLKTQKNH